MLEAEGGELGVEDEGAVLWVAGVASSLVGAAALPAVGGHEVPELGVDEGDFRAGVEFFIAPGAEAVEAVLEEEFAGGGGPFFGVAELVDEAFFCSGGAEHFERGDGAVDEEVAFWVDEPPAAIDLLGVEESGGGLGGAGEPAEAAASGAGWVGREAGKIS